VILKQIYLGCLAQASYLIADEETKTAAVVDPRRDVGEYLDAAAKAGVQIRHILLTHFHADFVSGHLELHRRTGATIHLGARGRADYEFHALHDGDTIELGGVTLRILETPGHTPESISIVVLDRGRLHAVLTGDTLFVGDVGRPDLMASIGVTAGELASQLYDSIHSKLLALPDETILYPGHGAGSMCGKALAEETFSTLGHQRRFNPMLQPMAKAEFVRLVTYQAEPPAYFGYDADLNRRRRATLDEVLAGFKPLPWETLPDDAQIVDTREPADYQRSHVINSFNVPLAGKYATYSGMVLDPSKPIVLITDDGREQEAAMRLGRIGFDRVAGYVQGGIRSIPERRRRGAPHVTVAELATWIARPDAPVLLDVRQPGEFKASHLDGAMHIPLGRLRERAGELPRGRWIAIYCRTGHRSSIAQSILEQVGIESANVDGGIVAWQEEKRAVTA